MKTVLITGATGFVGRALMVELLRRGHKIKALTTQDAQIVAESIGLPVQWFTWSPRVGHMPEAVWEGVEVVVNLAGKNLGDHFWSPKVKSEILSSRIESVNTLIESMTKVNAKPVILSASAIGIYADEKEKWLEESSPMGSDFLSEVCHKWESAWEGWQQSPVCIMRIGVVLGRGGGFMQVMDNVFSRGVGSVLGTGKQWLSWIHLSDLVGIFLGQIENFKPVAVINAVAPEPISNVDMTIKLAGLWRKRTLPALPSWFIKLVLGEKSLLALKSARVKSTGAVKIDYEFQVKTFQDSLALDYPFDGSFFMQRYQWINRKVPEVFEFFSDPLNLEQITPPFLKFRVEKVSTPLIQTDTLIDYQLKVHGIPIRWQSKIDIWIKNEKFVDRQLKGPYQFWHHQHNFEEIAGGTLIWDKVQYKIPFGGPGNLVMAAKVQCDVQRIFDYRFKKLKSIFT